MSISRLGGLGGLAAHVPGTSGGNPSDWREPPKRQRDPKRIALVLGLAILSWVATLVGMLELIEANVGTLPITHRSSSRDRSRC
jgi:hypothetical protein